MEAFLSTVRHFFFNELTWWKSQKHTYHPSNLYFNVSKRKLERFEICLHTMNCRKPFIWLLELNCVKPVDIQVILGTKIRFHSLSYWGFQRLVSNLGGGWITEIYWQRRRPVTHNQLITEIEIRFFEWFDENNHPTNQTNYTTN